MVSDKLAIPLVDYSIAGSTTDNTIVEGRNPYTNELLPSTVNQIQDYISMNQGSDLPQHSLFVISTGSNDYLLDPKVESSKVALRVESAAKALEGIGARSFVIVAPTGLSFQLVLIS